MGFRRSPLQEVAALSWGLVLNEGLSYIAPGEPPDLGASSLSLRIDLSEARAMAADIVRAVAG